jgi:predicted ribosomally synthesized peptide with nif11-like leader
MGADQVTAFLNALRDDEALRMKLTTLAEGDWPGIVKIAQAHGFTFTSGELISQIPESFFKGHGSDPERGWERNTVPDK